MTPLLRRRKAEAIVIGLSAGAILTLLIFAAHFYWAFGTEVLTAESDATGVYYDENGKPMLASAHVRDPAFAARYVTETRALLATAKGA